MTREEAKDALALAERQIIVLKKIAERHYGRGAGCVWPERVCRKIIALRERARECRKTIEELTR